MEKLEKRAAILEATNKQLKELRYELNEEIFNLRTALLAHRSCPNNLPLNYLLNNSATTTFASTHDVSGFTQPFLSSNIPPQSYFVNPEVAPNISYDAL